MADITTPLLAADGTPLKKKLNQALFRGRVRAVSLVMPLFLFILLSFVFPIILLLWEGVHNDTFEAIMPETTKWLEDWDAVSEPDEAAYTALIADIRIAAKDRTIGQAASRVNRDLSGTRSLFTSTARKIKNVEGPPYKENFLEVVGNKNAKKWRDIATWQAMKISSTSLTPAFYAAAVDLKYNADGSIVQAPEDRRIHVKLYLRTFAVAAVVAIFCFILGFPVAFLLASLPQRISSLLMIFVLLPFWTSLLVRTTAWIAILQGQGVINDLLVYAGLNSDDSRLSLIYNMTGSLIAMTHILLPFMILPLYSVMKGIPPSYVRAAKSLGANDWTAFWRVYFPMTVPGIGAGSLLVFILAIGYYITPALVGGQDGQLISNFIAYHMKSSLNWSLAAALGGLLLFSILILYWIYDKIVGIDNMKLG